MKILTSSNVASLVNLMLRNARGTTTAATDGATSDGLIAAEDLNNLIDCGTELSNLITVENFRNVVTGMLEGVGKILYENAKLSSPSRFDLFIDENEYMTVIEKVRISAPEFEQSYIHATSGGSSFADMFNNHPLTFTVKVWNTVGDYRTKPYTISMIQLRSAVNNPAELTRLLGEIYGIVEVTYYTAIREAEKRIIINQIANCCMYKSGALVIDVLKAYYDETGDSLTTATMNTSDSFKRWFYGYFAKVKMLMGEISGNYNCESNLINTDGEDIRSFLTEPFATSLRTISVYQNGEYFKDALVGTKFIPFIQNINEPQKISCMPVNPPVITTGKHVTNVACENILGMIWDRRGTFLTATKIETGYMENNYDKWTNYVHNFSVREMCDKGSNAVVFVAKDKSGSNKAYTITEANDT
ncbi:MAG: hypothetical protein IKT42_04145 [Clostridia bacterium]|nr:hypothetical protein [Clostridia bacterium]